MTGNGEPLIPDYHLPRSNWRLIPEQVLICQFMQRFAFELFARQPRECPRQTTEARLEACRIAVYCRARISSIAALPPRSTLTTLCTGLKPVSVTSTM